MKRIPIFLSAPKPYLQRQEDFQGRVENELLKHDLYSRTLGRSDYSVDSPLLAIRRLMNECCGLICLGFRRSHIEKGADRPASDLGEAETSKDGAWLTSPYCQIEPAMAYQIGLPLIIWREQNVVADGLMDRGALGLSMPEFDLDSPPDIDTEEKWKQPLREWIDQVRAVYRKRGEPPRLW